MNLFVVMNSKQVNTLDIEEVRKTMPNTVSIKNLHTILY